MERFICDRIKTRSGSCYAPKDHHLAIWTDCGCLKSIWEAPDRATSDIHISRLLEDYRHYKGFDEWFEENVEDCLAVFEQPPSHRRRLRTTNCIERMNEEIRRRTEPLRIFLSREGAMRMLTALWEDIHEKWITGRVYLNMETLKEWEERKETPDQTRDEEMVL